MKRYIYMFFLVNLTLFGQANAFEKEDYCVIKDATCYWCNTQGMTDDGYCSSYGYYECPDTFPHVVRENGQMVDSQGHARTCSTYGWCYDDCSWKIPETRYIDVGQGITQIETNGTGCMCDDWKRVKYSCSAGYYGTPNEIGTTGCTECPSYTNAAGQTFRSTSEVDNNTNVTDCWLEGKNGPFSDNVGIYEIIDGKCMFSNSSDLKPVPGGGTIVKPTY